MKNKSRIDVSTVIVVAVILVIVVLTAFYILNYLEKKNAVCSSISCQSEESCAEMGFDRSWYQKIRGGLGRLPAMPDAVEVDEDEVHCISWMDSDLSMLMREGKVFNSSGYSMIIRDAWCEDVAYLGTVVSFGKATGDCGWLENVWDSTMDDCGKFVYRVMVNGSVTGRCLILDGEEIFSESEDGVTGAVTDGNCRWV